MLPTMAVPTEDVLEATSSERPLAERGDSVKGRTPWRELWRRTLQRRSAVLGLAVLLLFFAVAALSLVYTPYDPLHQDIELGLAPPSLAHPFGTDELGRDILSRIMAGSRITITVGFGAVAICAIAGTTLGMLAGYYRGWIDALVMRIMDILLAFPGLLFALIVAAVLRPGVMSVILAVGTAGIPNFARVARGGVLALREEEYVVAARTVGASNLRILFRHIAPNVTASVIVLATLYIAFAVLIASALSFLGVGVPPPYPEWGAMTNTGRHIIATAWWVSTFPGLMIMIFVLAVNLLGDGVRDALDPGLRL